MTSIKSNYAYLVSHHAIWAQEISAGHTPGHRIGWLSALTASTESGPKIDIGWPCGQGVQKAGDPVVWEEAGHAPRS